MPDPTHLLIVGTPRSGTTLLTSLVGYHSDCIAMSECYSCEENKIVSPSKVLVNKLCCPNQVQLEHPKPLQLEDPELRALLERITYKWWAKLISSLAGNVLRDWPIGSISMSRYVKKREARLLFTLRKPDQVIDSMVRRGVAEKKAVLRWAHGVQEIAAAHSQYESRSLIITFSRLVKNPEQVLRSVCQFLNIEYQEEMVDGFIATPQYDRDKIDGSVADKNVPDYTLESRRDDSYNLYRKLRSESLGRQ